ncbi:MAG: zinc ribbon domain-containing protein [Christensenellales bacterium]
MIEDKDEKMQKHLKTKKKLKTIGPIVLAVGVILAIIGMVDFFVSMSSSGRPTLFFMAFLGMPTAVAGGVITMYGYQREMGTYIKNESVPVFNEAGEEIAPAIQSIAKAAKEGSEEKLTCECGELNDVGSKFCKKCGKPLFKTCPYCGQEVDVDSEFCNHCGRKI